MISNSAEVIKYDNWVSSTTTGSRVECKQTEASTATITFSRRFRILRTLKSTTQRSCMKPPETPTTTGSKKTIMIAVRLQYHSPPVHGSQISPQTKVLILLPSYPALPTSAQFPPPNASTSSSSPRLMDVNQVPPPLHHDSILS
ncbi:hypothetical protein SK128_018938 [Halocaridina rubra]|uniref:Uncharacterized protein n=1 Tax=Halocaridina rubra TaxID=373956 RepID=A0AAN8X329_HALRR